MKNRFAQLLDFDADHSYFEGAGSEFLKWEPTPACARAMTGLRLLYRATPNGGLVLYETDSDSSGLASVIPLSNHVALTFAATELTPAFAGATDPTPELGKPFYFTNRVGSLEANVGRPHFGAFAAAADQVRVLAPATVLQFSGLRQTDTLAIRDANGTLVVERQVTPEDGSASVAVDLTPWAPGAFAVQLGENASETIYADLDLPACRPVAILDLVLAPRTGAGFSILNDAGQPVVGGRSIRAHFQGKATIWRYIVVPSESAPIPLADIRLVHFPTQGRAFTFVPAGTRTMPTAATAAVFESSAPIALRSIPYRGLTLQRRLGAQGQFVSLATDLPNPSPEPLSPSSAPGRPVSEVFIYI